MPDNQHIVIEGLHFTSYLSQEQIQSRIEEIAQEINSDLREKHPLFIVVLNGAFMFASDLLKQITLMSEIVFVRLKSYQGAHSSGKVEEVIGLDIEIAGRELVIIEDIVDSGYTMYNFTKSLMKKTPASISIVTLLFKPQSLIKEVLPSYVGFEINDRFVVGFGLDYNGYGRNYPEIFQLEEQNNKG